MNQNIEQEIIDFNNTLSTSDKEICDLLANVISNKLPNAENKIWHRHPVWFLNDNPITGYNKLKKGIRLMFWSGASFEEEKLSLGTGKFKDASFFYNSVDEIDVEDLKRWLKKSIEIQWDYKNIYKTKGVLNRLK